MSIQVPRADEARHQMHRGPSSRRRCSMLDRCLAAVRVRRQPCRSHTRAQDALFVTSIGVCVVACTSARCLYCRWRCPCSRYQPCGSIGRVRAVVEVRREREAIASSSCNRSWRVSDAAHAAKSSFWSERDQAILHRTTIIKYRSPSHVNTASANPPSDATSS